jgi:hypothetical protein
VCGARGRLAPELGAAGGRSSGAAAGTAARAIWGTDLGAAGFPLFGDGVPGAVGSA